MEHQLKDEVLIELTRRAARGGLHAQGTGTWQTNQWAQYQLLLDLASRLLAQAPQNAQDCKELDIEARTSEAMTQVVKVLHRILPGGIMEAISYLSEQERREGWGAECEW